MTITVDILKAIAPGSKKTNYKHLAGLALWMNHWFPVFQIDTKAEICHFLTQAAHETDSFNSLVEYGDDNYFSKYDGRKDLGNINPGDGLKYKGRGVFQNTGLANYVRLDSVLNDPTISFELHPGLLETSQYAVWSACVFWNDRHFNDTANMREGDIVYVKRLDKNLTPLQYITYRVNGSIKTVPQRQKFYERAKEVIK